VTLEPAFESFEPAYRDGRVQVVYQRLVDDLETPVSAYLKVAHGKPYSFLFESVEGGAWRGRYSALVMAPDLVWRCRGGQAEIAEGEAIAAGRFSPDGTGALDSLRDLVARSRLELPAGLPPMAAGVFGVLGYDMVRLAERLPNANPDPLDLPDAVMIRPSIVAIFDGVAQEIILVTTVRPSGLEPAAAYAAARARIETVIHALRQPLPTASPHRSVARIIGPWSSGPRTTSAPVTSSRWCRATGCGRPSRTIPSPSIARCGGPTPPRSSSSSTSRSSSWRAPRRRSWCACATARSPSGPSPARGRGARRRRRTRRWRPN
jgi:hypothetical protein